MQTRKRHSQDVVSIQMITQPLSVRVKRSWLLWRQRLRREWTSYTHSSSSGRVWLLTAFSKTTAPPSTQVTQPTLSVDTCIKQSIMDLCFPLLENDGTCIEESAVIAVSAVSLLLIVTLTTVIVIQCLQIIRMKRSFRNTTSPLTSRAPIPVSPNEAYGLTVRSTTSSTKPTNIPISPNETDTLSSDYIWLDNSYFVTIMQSSTSQFSVWLLLCCQCTLWIILQDLKSCIINHCSPHISPALHAVDL